DQESVLLDRFLRRFLRGGAMGLGAGLVGLGLGLVLGLRGLAADGGLGVFSALLGGLGSGLAGFLGGRGGLGVGAGGADQEGDGDKCVLHCVFRGNGGFGKRVAAALTAGESCA